MKKKYYITTTLPYVNADPHIGFAAEIVRADVLARLARRRGEEVFFNTGTDEHGLKIQRKAEEQGKSTQAYVDEYAAKFDNLKKALNLSYDNFIRTTEEHHKKAAQEFWRRCAANGDIYKKNYKVNYCVGCELELTESELVGGKCPHHPNSDLEIIDEENYFFRWSNYQDKLLGFYEANPDFIVPRHRMNEIANFIKNGLQDFSISRLKTKMPWGVSVPGDEEHVMYVWFDALINYVSCLGWPDDESRLKEFWGQGDFRNAIQVAGKDNLRQQTAMWQAMLMSAGLANSKQILIFGFINIDGQKMSKSLGNVVSPYDLTAKYGVDAVRYYLLSGLKAFEDSNFTTKHFEEKYSADLANGLGNLVARVSNLIEKNELQFSLQRGSSEELIKKFELKLAEYSFDEALKVLWDEIGHNDEILSEKTPWKLKDKEAISQVLEPVAASILNVADLLEPFLPETAEKIIAQFSAEKIRKGDSLFPRLA
jgi:methionyl-tRNA synthetase